MDAINRKLIELLRANARESTSSLARKLGLSRTAVHQRIARLERDGVIEGYTLLRLNPQAQHRLIQAEVMIRINPKMNGPVIAALHRIEAVRVLYAINGRFDLVARIAATTPDAIDRVLDRIGSIAGIEKTLSSIVLSTKFER